MLSGKGIAKELTSIEVVKNISDDSCETKRHYLLVAYSLEYKIEFSFDKANKACQYIMVEENEINREKQNVNIKFIDDISIFGQHVNKVREKFQDCISFDNCLRIGDAELYFEDEKVYSLYYLPPTLSLIKK
ncbi:hypothetical protein EEL50_13775 [Muribaculaceae bacterium Isolate-105 (HZI)]|nr:hypothetical protein EEL50_13775 [Muribaculaceae bacterium Isolate-105 (HZI)]